MKIRNGFVSNSSSSSFIVIGEKLSNDLIDKIKIDINRTYALHHGSLAVVGLRVLWRGMEWGKIIVVEPRDSGGPIVSIVLDDGTELHGVTIGEWEANSSYVLTIDDKGVTEFGWTPVKYDSFWDRLNFTIIQIMYLSADYKELEEYKMLERVLKTYLGVNNIENKLSLDYDCKKSQFYSYIDHQSCITEGRNDEMLENEDSLAKFLFSKESYIQGGNDNN